MATPETDLDQSLSSADRLVIRRPDDWHLHLRDGAMLATVVNYTARQFARAIIMPNLVPPVTTADAALAYRNRIMAVLSEKSDFTPLMTCYLTDDIAPSEIKRGHDAGIFTAAKLYPAHATTNSSHGVTDIRNIYPALEVMQKLGMPLLLHGEVTHKEVDIFDREAVFINKVLKVLLNDFPELKVVFEHITTKEAAQFVAEAGPNLAATITPHHLSFNRNAMFEGGIRPHYYCLPVAKREEHRLALRRAAISGSGKFFLGTDSAPHAAKDKETACGCAGLFNAPYAMEAYAEVFDEESALDKLEGFASEFGPKFYGLPLNEGKIVLERVENAAVKTCEGPTGHLVPFRAGETLPWRFAGIK
ncbi:MAG: dihydroorotase [Alphaproteobacteria bacterium]|nr:MAG: dihydroorotase [Alphaproteobacteria bacterium]